MKFTSTWTIFKGIQNSDIFLMQIDGEIYRGRLHKSTRDYVPEKVNSLVFLPSTQYQIYILQKRDKSARKRV